MKENFDCDDVDESSHKKMNFYGILPSDILGSNFDEDQNNYLRQICSNFNSTENFSQLTSQYEDCDFNYSDFLYNRINRMEEDPIDYSISQTFLGSQIDGQELFPEFSFSHDSCGEPARVNKIFNERVLLTDHQFGFQSPFSTGECLLRDKFPLIDDKVYDVELECQPSPDHSVNSHLDQFVPTGGFTDDFDFFESYESYEVDYDKRLTHNERERLRRREISDLTLDLKELVPSVAGKKASRKLILEESEKFISYMVRQNNIKKRKLISLSERYAELCRNCYDLCYGED